MARCICRRRWWLLATILISMLLAACSSGDSGRPWRLAVTTTGLPANVQAPVWEVTAGPFAVERGPELGSLSSGTQAAFSLAGPLIEIGDVHNADGSRFRPAQRFYGIDALVAELHVPFRRQVSVDAGVWVRSNNLVGAPDIRVEPASEDGYYDEGTLLSAEVALTRGQRLAYWMVREGPADPELIRKQDFASALPRMVIELRRSVQIVGVIMGKWERHPRVPNQLGITVDHLVEGQRVRLRNDRGVVAEVAVGKGEYRATLPIPTGPPLQGAFEITAPDGETVIFDSPGYSDLAPGDSFGF